MCSTVAATRPAVNEEVRLFRSRHPDRPVIPVIIEGTYPANFPPALRFALAADGSVTDQPVTILGPDLRKTGDGRTLGLAKIAAGLTGLATDDLHKRLKRQQRRQAWINGVVAACLMVLVPHLIETVNGLEARGVSFRSLTEAIDTTTPGGRLIFHIFGALGQFERDLIRERTRAGLDAAMAPGSPGRMQTRRG